MLPFPGDWHILYNYQKDFLQLLKIYGDAELLQLAKVAGHRSETLKSLARANHFKRTHHFIQSFEAIYRLFLQLYLHSLEATPEAPHSQIPPSQATPLSANPQLATSPEAPPSQIPPSQVRATANTLQQLPVKQNWKFPKAYEHSFQYYPFTHLWKPCVLNDRPVNSGMSTSKPTRLRTWHYS